MTSSPNKMKFKSKNGNEAKITFDTSRIYYYYYWCTPHKDTGMIGLFVVGNDLSNIDVIASAKAIGKSKKKLRTLLATLKQFQLPPPFTVSKRRRPSMGPSRSTLVTSHSHLGHTDFDKMACV